MNKTIDCVLRDLSNGDIKILEAHLQMKVIIASMIGRDGPSCKECGDYGIINVRETDMYKTCSCTN